jgi:hypothetical protein
MQTSSRPRGRALAALLVGTAVVTAAGCDNEREKLPRVSGTITVGGNPVPSGTVTFYPDAAKGNSSGHQPNGVLDAQGAYELFLPGGRKGAPAGWYKVVVYAVDDPQPGKPNKYLVNKEYADVNTTPLSIEVVENPEPDRYSLKLKR